MANWPLRGRDVAGDLAIHCPYMLYGVIVCVGVRCMCSVSYER